MPQKETKDKPTTGKGSGRYKLPPGPGRKKGIPNKATREIRSLAQLHGTACIEGLAKLMNHRNAGVKLAAIKEMLEWGYTKPKDGAIPLAGLQVIIGTFVQPTALPGPAIGPVIDIKANGHGGNGSTPPA